MEIQFRKKKVREKKDTSGVASAPSIIQTNTKRVFRTTFDQDDEEAIVFDKKLVRIETIQSIEEEVTRPTYDLKSLAALKLDQSKVPKVILEETTEVVYTEAFIPDQGEIDRTKILRDRKRAANEQNLQPEPDYISINQTVAMTQNSSRHVTEDQDEEQEAYDDYNGAAIVFGSRAIVEARKTLDEEKLEMILGRDEADEDDQFREWEIRQIQSGHGAMTTPHNITVVHNKVEKPIELPQPIPLLNFDDIMADLDSTIANLRGSIQQKQYNIELANHNENPLETKMERFKSEIVIASNRFDYFQDLSSYMSDLSEFIEEKEPVVLLLETAYLDIMVDDATKLSAIRKTVSDEASRSVFRGIPLLDAAITDQPMNLQSPAELVTLKESSFEDVSKYFKKASHVKERFVSWRRDHRREYDQGYGALSIAGMFDVHVRLELLDWSPFTAETSFESMEWHDQLMDFDDSTSITGLLPSIIERTCIPRFQTLVSNGYDIYSPCHTDNALKCLNILLDYTSIKSEPMQSLLDTFEYKISTSIDDSLDRIPPNRSLVAFQASNEDCECKAIFLSPLIQVLENAVKWRRFLPSGIVKRWSIEKLLSKAIMPALDTCQHIRTDLELYIKVAEAIKDLIPEVYSTPADLKFLEVSFLKSILLPAEKDPVLRTSFIFSRILHFLSTIKSFAACSLVAKTLESI